MAKKTATTPAKRKKRPQKGALIKGISGKLPRELFDNVVFRRKLKELMKGYSGIYALYSDDKLYYVGLTNNLFTRLNTHRRRLDKGKWDSFVIFRIRRVSLLKDIETLVMSIIHPPGNSVRGRLPKDSDLNRVLREIVRDQKKQLNTFNKALKGR